jgi:hypothetical protein
MDFMRDSYGQPVLLAWVSDCLLNESKLLTKLNEI